jgi:hypothetical protein
MPASDLKRRHERNHGCGSMPAIPPMRASACIAPLASASTGHVVASIALLHHLPTTHATSPPHDCRQRLRLLQLWVVWTKSMLVARISTQPTSCVPALCAEGVVWTFIARRGYELRADRIGAIDWIWSGSLQDHQSIVLKELFRWIWMEVDRYVYSATLEWPPID